MNSKENVTFQGSGDRYNGITVNSLLEPCDLDKFKCKLLDSIDKWLLEKKKCIWFQVNIQDSVWIPVLANEGFNFHHSRKDFVTMYKWLPNNSPNLPPASHTDLGVGGIVFNDNNQILVVSEKYLDFPHWKLPGGYVERGEDIKDAAIREVKEETGIETSFQSLVTFRHTHNSQFGNSDIYVVVTLKALSDVINKSDKEIKECQWMDIEEYLNHPHVHEFNRFILKQALDLQERKIKFDLQKKEVKISKWTRQVTMLTLEDV